MPQEADTHPMMEERCAAPLRGAELSAPGGAGPGQKETSFFRLPSGEMFEKPDIQWRGWWPSTVAQQAL